MLPASVGFMVLARTIIQTIFEGGRFDAYSTTQTADILFFYSIGLFAYGATKILQSCFFALKDTKTPAKLSFLALIINIILNSLLMFPMKLAGLALATSLSGINTCLILFFILRKRLRPFDTRVIISSFVRILVASLFMGAICYLFSQRIFFLGTNMFYRLLNLGLSIIIGIIFYIAFCFIFRVVEMQELWRWVRRRKMQNS